MASRGPDRRRESQRAYLSETTRRRIAAGILIAGAVLAFLAITNTAFFSDPPSEEDLAGDAVQEFFQAGIDGDFDRYCELLTPAARDMVKAGASRLLEDLDERLSCGDIVEQLAADRFEGLEVRVRRVSVSGNRARVEASLKLADAPAEFRTLLLEMDSDGNWLISDQG